MKILVIGEAGQVAWELRRTLACVGTVIAVGRPLIDLADADSIRGTIRGYTPNLIVNAAAYTAVDKAEDEPALAMKVNGVAPAIMAEEAKRISAGFVTYSTDYVFDGAKHNPYTETDSPNPLCEYGRTKLAGDRAVESIGAGSLILRTSWVYSGRGSNFLLKMLNLSRERSELKVVDDQIGAPTSARSIAEATAQIVSQITAAYRTSATRASVGELFSEYRSIYNVTCQGKVSWHGFTKAILEYRRPGEVETSRANLTAIRTGECLARAKRPGNSVLDNAKLQQTFGVALPDWSDCLGFVMEEMGYRAQNVKAVGCEQA